MYIYSYCLGIGVLYDDSILFPKLTIAIHWDEFLFHILAARTEVLSLQEICIDRVAETLNSPRHAHLLPLSPTLKEKVSKVVFDPDVDFCYDDFLQYRRDSDSDTVLHHVVYKDLISAVR